jgi:hypothetical protein
MSSRKKQVRKVLFAFVAIILISLIYFTFQLIERNEVREKNIQMLPALTLFELDSTAFGYEKLNPNYSTIFVFFNSECSLCQEEARLFKNNPSIFAQSNQIWVSEESLEKIRKFSSTYRLQDSPYTFALQSPANQFYEKFGLTVRHVLPFMTPTTNSKQN